MSPTYSRLALPTCMEFGFAAECEASARHAQAKADHVFCITVYNESLEPVTATIRSILLGLLELRNRGATDRLESCICIMVDGAEHADAQVLDWLRTSGFIRNGYELLGEGCTIYRARQQLRRILEYTCQKNENLVFASEISVNVVVCLKRQNRGKLHSQAIFLRTICPSLSPDYCYQIDAGTVVDENAIFELVKHIDGNGHVAALAPCILVAPPVSTRQILSVWQYSDFLMQKAVWWPFEVSAGHLSVLPGQFCMFRWKALVPERAAVNDRGAAHIGPINAYLRGLVADSPFERLMFLAEDRVIGNEIVVTPERRWILDYASTAQATTDACKTFSELLRQRRRWNNSTLACRLWLLAQWPSYLKRNDRSSREKVAFSFALAAQALLVLFDLIAPATLICTVAFMLSVLGISVVPKFVFFKSIFGVVLGVTSALCCANVRWPSRLLDICSTTLLAVSAIMLVGVFAISLPMQCLFVIWTPILLSAVAIFCLSGHDRWRDLQLYNSYLTTNFVITAALSIYSMWKIDDISWGTKGLRSFARDRRFDYRMRWLKTAAWLVWLGLNGALAFIGLTIQGFTSPHINVVIELECLSYAVIAVTALVGRARRSGKLLARGDTFKVGVSDARPASGS